MKKQVSTLLIPIGFLLIIGCNRQEKSKNDSQETSTKISKTVVDSSKIYKQQAIKILDEVNRTMKKSIMGEISQKDTNKEINPKMEQLLKLMAKMSPTDTLEVHNYRVQEVNKIINLQIEH
jgi:polyhydroxyalkanoate synthesis regulator phasin